MPFAWFQVTFSANSLSQERKVSSDTRCFRPAFGPLPDCWTGEADSAPRHRAARSFGLAESRASGQGWVRARKAHRHRAGMDSHGSDRPGCRLHENIVLATDGEYASVDLESNTNSVEVTSTWDRYPNILNASFADGEPARVERQAGSARRWPRGRSSSRAPSGRPRPGPGHANLLPSAPDPLPSGHGAF